MIQVIEIALFLLKKKVVEEKLFQPKLKDCKFSSLT